MRKVLKLLLSNAILCFIVSSSCFLNAQSNFFLKDNISKKINFELNGNLIIIPIEINGVELSFVLDTGVSKPILFNLAEKDSLDLRHTETFYLHGLGADGKLKALKSRQNTFKIGDATSVNQDLYVVFDNTINFTPRLGVIIHGIIGYDVFKNFVVEINYSSKFIRLHKPDTFKPKSSKKWKTLPINIDRRKPYIDSKIVVNDSLKSVKLLIDTGSSDALWIFEDKRQGLTPDANLVFEDFLGKGLSGSVYGKRSKVKSFHLSDFILSNVNVAFPDSISIDRAKLYKERSGSVGGSILKRFNIHFDYTNRKIYFKKNSYYNDPFTYNNSGIVLEHNGSMFIREQIKVTD